MRKHPHGRGEDDPHIEPEPLEPETPPRAWGRPGSGISRKKSRRNTPTGVGKTATYWAFKYLNHNILFK